MSKRVDLFDSTYSHFTEPTMNWRHAVWSVSSCLCLPASMNSSLKTPAFNSSKKKTSPKMLL